MPNSPSGYDPYFIPTTFEVIQSQLVLGRVVTNLNLNKVWSDKYFKGAQLNTPKTIEIIKSKISLEPVRNTRLLNITFHSDDPKEAALLANAIAEVYRDYHTNQRIKMLEKGLEVLQGQYQDEEKRISLLQTNNEQLVEIHKLLAAKIEYEKTEFGSLKNLPVQIVDQAEPPQSPVGPNRSLGATMLTTGLLSSLGAILLLKASRQPAA